MWVIHKETKEKRLIYAHRFNSEYHKEIKGQSTPFIKSSVPGTTAAGIHVPSGTAQPKPAPRLAKPKSAVEPEEEAVLDEEPDVEEEDEVEVAEDEEVEESEDAEDETEEDPFEEEEEAETEPETPSKPAPKKRRKKKA